MNDFRSDTTIDWALGLPLFAERPLSPDERQAFRRSVAQLRLRVLSMWLAYPLAWAVFGLIAAQANANNSIEQDALAVVAILLVIPALPIMILLTKDWQRRIRGMSGDLKANAMQLFAGSMTEEAGYDPAFQKLRQRGLIPHDVRDNWSVEILPASRRIWTVDSVGVRVWVEARVAAIARPPLPALANAVWISQTDTGDGSFDIGMRTLSSAEKEELARYARRCWLNPLPMVIGLSIWMSMPITAIILKSYRSTLFDDVHLAALTVLTMSAYVFLFSGISRSRRYLQDRYLGEVSIAHLRAESVEEGLFDDDLDTNNVEERVERPGNASLPEPIEEWYELLPASGAMWTQNGRPAAWRKIPPS